MAIFAPAQAQAHNLNGQKLRVNPAQLDPDKVNRSAPIGFGSNVDQAWGQNYVATTYSNQPAPGMNRSYLAAAQNNRAKQPGLPFPVGKANMSGVAVPVIARGAYGIPVKNGYAKYPN